MCSLKVKVFQTFRFQVFRKFRFVFQICVGTYCPTGPWIFTYLNIWRRKILIQLINFWSCFWFWWHKPPLHNALPKSWVHSRMSWPCLGKMGSEVTFLPHHAGKWSYLGNWEIDSETFPPKPLNRALWMGSIYRVANPKGEAFICDPQERVWPTLWCCFPPLGLISILNNVRQCRRTAARRRKLWCRKWIRPVLWWSWWHHLPQNLMISTSHVARPFISPSLRRASPPTLDIIH